MDKNSINAIEYMRALCGILKRQMNDFKENSNIRILINTFSLILLLIIILVSNNCTRENDITLKDPAETIRGNWKLIDKKNIDKYGDTMSTISYYAECVVDDIYSFEENEILFVFDKNDLCSFQQDSNKYQYIIRESRYNANEYELLIISGHGHNVVDDGISGDINFFDKNSFMIKRYYGCGDSAGPVFCVELIEFKKEN